VPACLYVDVVAECCARNPASGGSRIRDGRAFSFHTHAYRVIDHKADDCGLLHSESDVVDRLVSIFRSGALRHNTTICSTTGAAYLNRADLLSPLLDLPTRVFAALVLRQKKFVASLTSKPTQGGDDGCCTYICSVPDRRLVIFIAYLAVLSRRSGKRDHNANPGKTGTNG
jgi:hypothetical protein